MKKQVLKLVDDHILQIREIQQNALNEEDLDVGSVSALIISIVLARVLREKINRLEENAE